MRETHNLRKEHEKKCKNCRHSSFSNKECEYRKQITPYYEKEFNREITYLDLMKKEQELQENLTCNEYKCQYIEFPLTLEDVSIENIEYNKNGIGHKVGCLVGVSPCKEEYKDKTYLGIYLGDLPMSVSLNVDTNKIMNIYSGTNPAMYVFELNKIIFGYESWWYEIKSIDKLKQITNEDIENTWYVKMLKNMLGDNEDKNQHN